MPSTSRVVASAVVGLALLLLGLTVWAVGNSYEFDLARCGALPSSYSPEWGWLLFVAPPAFLGLIAAGVAIFLETSQSAPRAWVRWLLVTIGGVSAAVGGVLAVAYFAVGCGYQP